MAGVDAIGQARVMDALFYELPRRLDLTEARGRRDKAIREALNLVYTIRDKRDLVSTITLLTAALYQFHAEAWPRYRHLAAPPVDMEPFRRALFYACQASEDMGKDLPGTERQIYNITKAKTTRR